MWEGLPAGEYIDTRTGRRVRVGPWTGAGMNYTRAVGDESIVLALCAPEGWWGVQSPEWVAALAARAPRGAMTDAVDRHLASFLMRVPQFAQDATAVVDPPQPQPSPTPAIHPVLDVLLTQITDTAARIRQHPDEEADLLWLRTYTDLAIAVAQKLADTARVGGVNWWRPEEE